MSIKLLNIRHGFATNSSSLHSCCIRKDIVSNILSRKYVDEEEKPSFNSEFYFGWDDFICSDPEAVEKYLFSQFWSNLCKLKVSIPVRFALTRELFSDKIYQAIKTHEKEIIRDNHWENELIDHQSKWTIPPNFKSKQLIPDIEFFNDIKNYVVNNNMIIFGGNDNNPSPEIQDYLQLYEIAGLRDQILPKIQEYGSHYDGVYCLKDGFVWKFFDIHNGNKLRFSFNKDVEYPKSSVPELVDLIISNQCQTGCSFCYRGCTPDSKVASYSNLRKIIGVLLDLGVFEIIIGGGDILSYPHFKNLVWWIHADVKKYYNSVFSTTLDLKSILRNPENFQLAKTIFKGISISIRNLEDFHEFCSHPDIFKRNSRVDDPYISPYRDYMIQIVPELWKYSDLVKFFEENREKTRIRVMFLGFKNTGRGENLPPELKKNLDENRSNHKKFLDLLLEEGGSYYFRCDTQFIKTFPRIKEEVVEISYTEHEGKYSCCIDAVDNTISASSYDSEIVDLFPKNKKSNNDYSWNLGKRILEEYQKF